MNAEDYDAGGRVRCTHTRDELDRGRGRGTETLQRDWIIHWHTPEGFTALARDAGLTVTHPTPVEAGEFAAHLRRTAAQPDQRP